MSNLWKALRDVSRDVDPTVGFEPEGQGLHGDDAGLELPTQEPAGAAAGPATDESSALARRLTNPARPPQPRGGGSNDNAGEAPPPVLSKLGQALNATARPVPNGSPRPAQNGYTARPRPNAGIGQAAAPGPTAGRGRLPQDPAGARRLISSLSADPTPDPAAGLTFDQAPTPGPGPTSNSGRSSGPAPVSSPGRSSGSATTSGPGPTSNPGRASGPGPAASPGRASVPGAVQDPTAGPVQDPTAGAASNAAPNAGSPRATPGPGSGPSLLASRRALHDANSGPDRLTEDPGAGPGLTAGRRTTMEPPPGTPASHGAGPSLASNGRRPASDVGSNMGSGPSSAAGTPPSAAPPVGGTGTQGTSGTFSQPSGLPTALRAFAPGTPDIQYEVGTIVGSPRWHPGDDDVMPSDGRKAPRQRLRERFGL